MRRIYRSVVKPLSESAFFIGVTVLGLPIWITSLVINWVAGLFTSRKHILIFQTPRIGDMVCLTPVFREIKKKYPNAHITTAVPPPADAVTRYNPYIDRQVLYNPHHPVRYTLTLLWKLGFSRYDISFNFFPGPAVSVLPFWLGIPTRVTTVITLPSRTVKLLSVLNTHRFLYPKKASAPLHHLRLLGVLGIHDANGKREVFGSEAGEKKVTDLFRALQVASGERLVGITIGCGKEFRKWPLERFASLIEWLLAGYPVKILLVGGKEDIPAGEDLLARLGSRGVPRDGRILNLIDTLKIQDLPALFRRIELFIGVSTGPLFIADACGAKTAVIATDCGYDQSPQGTSVLVQNSAYPPRAHIMYPSHDPETAEPGMGITVAMMQEAVQQLLDTH